MDYLNTSAGRQYVAEATELTGWTCLTRTSRQLNGRSLVAVAFSQQPWIVHYGDG
jgi:hypothetical protein